MVSKYSNVPDGDVAGVKYKKGKYYSSSVPGKVDKIGDTQTNRIQINVSKVETEKNGMEHIMRTGAHEIGHTGGLNHNLVDKNIDKNNLPVESNNVMRQTGVYDEDTYKPLDNSYINSEQLNYINEKVIDNTKN